MGRDRFLFKLQWARILRAQRAEIRLEVYDAIMEYMLSGTLSELKPQAAMAFEFIKEELDNFTKQYDKAVEAHREAGRKGGAPAGNRNASKGADQNNQKQPKQPNVYENVNDNDNDNDNNLGRVNSSSSSHRSDAAAEEGDITEKRNDEILKVACSVKDYYNAQVVEHKARLRKCQLFSNERRRHVVARLNEYGEEKVRHVIDKAIQSRFLNYEARNAPVDLEWLMRPTNFPKVYDGNYDNRESPPPHSSSKVDNVHFTGEGNRSIYEHEEEKWRQPLSSDYWQSIQTK